MFTSTTATNGETMNNLPGKKFNLIDANLSRIVFCTISLILATPADAEFVKVEGIETPRLRQVAVSETDPSFITVASENSLYVSKDAGTSFTRMAVLKGETINHLFIDGDQAGTVYLAGSRNGYRVVNNIERVFTADEGEEVYFIRRYHDSLYAGTNKGLYSANHTLLNWQRLSGLGNDGVYSMTASGNDVYLACDSGVYSLRPDRSLTRLFIARNSDGSNHLLPRQVTIDTLMPSRLWLCTTKGVYYSNDRGETWQKLYLAGMGSIDAYCLVQFPLDGNHFYLCSDAGFLKVDITTGESRLLYAGLPTSNIHWADLTSSGDIYLATDQGLFKQVPTTALASSSYSTGGDLMKGEPTIREVQDAAMRYNSVHPDKTGNWRRRLKYRALLPKLSVDYDKTIGSSFTSSGYYYAQGPYDWGVTLTWDMGDLIWNSYEDDIDNRTKLTTQLRMDILDEVDRLYFERLRLKHEITMARSNLEDPTIKQLRLQELTATLDAYTGGLYSQ